jgi:hypothetical protein
MLLPVSYVQVFSSLLCSSVRVMNHLCLCCVRCFQRCTLHHVSVTTWQVWQVARTLVPREMLETDRPQQGIVANVCISDSNIEISWQIFVHEKNYLIKPQSYATYFIYILLYYFSGRYVSGIMFPSSGLSLYTYVISHNCDASHFSLFVL